MGAILAILGLACVPGLWAIWLLALRRAPRPWALRLALGCLFMTGAALGLTILSGGFGHPLEFVFSSLAAPVLFLVGLLEATFVGAFVSCTIGAIALAVWLTFCTRLPRPAAIVAAPVLGALTTMGAITLEDRVQAARITNSAQDRGATCFVLRQSFSEALARQWQDLFLTRVIPYAHAAATIDGVDHIWSYREGRFVPQHRGSPCQAPRN
ncbi:hypothetical protein [Gymnodinialimonas sp.]